MQRAPTVAPRTQLALAILLSTLSLSVGFMSTMPRTPATEQSDANAVGADDSTSKAAAAVPPQEAKRDGASRVESPAGRQAVFRKVLPYPFESVLYTWEHGPPDPNFLREDIVTTMDGSEEHKLKTIFVKNPLPFVIRKTIIRDEEFKFEEDQRIDLEKRYSYSTCVNKVIEHLATAHRSANMRADPANPNWTIFEQTMTISITGLLGNTVKAQLEAFAENLFVSSAERGTTTLEETLAHQQAVEAAQKQNQARSGGGGVWWSGGEQTLPSEGLHVLEAAVPQDSSSWGFNELLESWTSWILPSFFSEAGLGRGREDEAAASDGSDGVSGVHQETSEADKGGVSGSGSEGSGHGLQHAQRRTLLRARREFRGLADRVGQASPSVAAVLAGLAAQVVSAGDHHFGVARDTWHDVHSHPHADAAAAAGEGEGAGELEGGKLSAGHGLRDSATQAHSAHGQEHPLARLPVHLRTIGGHAAGAAAAFISAPAHMISSDMYIFGIR